MNNLRLEANIDNTQAQGSDFYDVQCINFETLIPSHGVTFSAHAFDDWLESRDPQTIVPLFRSHNSEVQIGSVDDFKASDQGLSARVYFSQNDDARNVHTLIEEGHLKTFSIGINGIVWGGDEYERIEKANLHELSTTAIPADAKARILNQLEEFHYSMHCQGDACNASKQLETLARDALGLSSKQAKKAVSILKQRDAAERSRKRLDQAVNQLIHLTD